MEKGDSHLLQPGSTGRPGTRLLQVATSISVRNTASLMSLEGRQVVQLSGFITARGQRCYRTEVLGESHVWK
jgi:hypothetical protein